MNWNRWPYALGIAAGLYVSFTYPLTVIAVALLIVAASIVHERYLDD